MKKAEQQYLDAIVQIGCIVCRCHGNESPAEVHHIVEGGKRKGHLFAIPLCPPHHRYGYEDEFCVSRHSVNGKGGKRAFEAAYGTEEELLARVKQILEGLP